MSQDASVSMSTGAVGAMAPPAMIRSPFGIGYPGWWMVFVCILSMAITFGLPTSTLPLIYSDVIREFGWSRTDATMAYSYKNLTSAVTALFIVAPFIDRLGLRFMMIAATVVTGAGMLMFLAISSLLTYNLAVVLIGAGQAFTMLGVKILISRWFTRRQGLAVGVALAGSSFGGAVFPLLFTFIEPDLGWRGTMAAMSVLIWVFVLPLYLLIAKENPTDADISRELVASTQAEADDAASALREADLGWTMRDVVRKPIFWIACLGIAIVQAVDSGMFQHTALFVENDLKLDPTMAAAALSGTFAFGIVSKIGAGWFFDKLSMRGIQLWWVLLAFAVVIAFGVQGGIMLAVFATARGLAHGGLVAESPIIAKHVFGPSLMNKVLPYFTGCLAIGGALGPILLSLCYDHYGNYTVGFSILAVLALVAAAMMTFVPPLYRQRLQAVLAARKAA